ncbi:MAG: flagellar export chaperone FliS [Steroidobacteraceae bacterium]
MNPFAQKSKLAAYQSIAAHGGVMGAGPHGLVLMLLDTAVERLTAARGCIERGETMRKAKLLHNCTRIVAELRGCLNLTDGGALAQNLSDLYDYMIRRLLVANTESRAAYLTEVLSLLGEIRGAWAAIEPEVRAPEVRPPEVRQSMARAPAAPAA